MKKMLSKIPQLMLYRMPEIVYLLGLGIAFWTFATALKAACDNVEAPHGLLFVGILSVAIIAIGAFALNVREEEKARKEKKAKTR